MIAGVAMTFNTVAVITNALGLRPGSGPPEVLTGRVARCDQPRPAWCSNSVSH